MDPEAENIFLASLVPSELVLSWAELLKTSKKPLLSLSHK